MGAQDRLDFRKGVFWGGEGPGGVLGGGPKKGPFSGSPGGPKKGLFRAPGDPPRGGGKTPSPAAPARGHFNNRVNWWPTKLLLGAQERLRGLLARPGLGGGGGLPGPPGPGGGSPGGVILGSFLALFWPSPGAPFSALSTPSR